MGEEQIFTGFLTAFRATSVLASFVHIIIINTAEK